MNDSASDSVNNSKNNSANVSANDSIYDFTYDSTYNSANASRYDPANDLSKIFQIFLTRNLPTKKSLAEMILLKRLR